MSIAETILLITRKLALQSSGNSNIPITDSPASLLVGTILIVIALLSLPLAIGSFVINALTFFSSFLGNGNSVVNLLTDYISYLKSFAFHPLLVLAASLTLSLFTLSVIFCPQIWIRYILNLHSFLLRKIEKKLLSKSKLLIDEYISTFNSNEDLAKSLMNELNSVFKQNKPSINNEKNESSLSIDFKIIIDKLDKLIRLLFISSNIEEALEYLAEYKLTDEFINMEGDEDYEEGEGELNMTLLIIKQLDIRIEDLKINAFKVMNSNDEKFLKNPYSIYNIYNYRFLDDDELTDVQKLQSIRRYLVNVLLPLTRQFRLISLVQSRRNLIDSLKSKERSDAALDEFFVSCFTDVFEVIVELVISDLKDNYNDFKSLLQKRKFGSFNILQYFASLSFGKFYSFLVPNIDTDNEEKYPAISDSSSVNMIHIKKIIKQINKGINNLDNEISTINSEEDAFNLYYNNQQDVNDDFTYLDEERINQFMKRLDKSSINSKKLRQDLHFVSNSLLKISSLIDNKFSKYQLITNKLEDTYGLENGSLINGCIEKDHKADVFLNDIHEVHTQTESDNLNIQNDILKELKENTKVQSNFKDSHEVVLSEDDNQKSNILLDFDFVDISSRDVSLKSNNSKSDFLNELTSNLQDRINKNIIN